MIKKLIVLFGYLLFDSKTILDKMEEQGFNPGEDKKESDDSDKEKDDSDKDGGDDADKGGSVSDMLKGDEDSDKFDDDSDKEKDESDKKDDGGDKEKPLYEQYGYESEEDLKADLERGKKFEDLEKERNELENKYNETSKKYSQIKDKNTIKNENLYRLNELDKEDPDKAKEIANVLYGNVNAKQLIVDNYIKNNPAVKDNKEMAEQLALEEFDVSDKLKPETKTIEDEEGEKKTVKDEAAIKHNNDLKEKAKAKMEIKADEVKRNVLKDFEKIEVPDGKSDEDIKKEKEEKQKEIIKKWQTPFKEKIVSQMKEINKITVKLEKGEIPVEVDISDEEKTQLEDLAATIILKEGGEPDEKRIDFINKVVEREFRFQKEEEIHMAIAEKVRKMNDKEWNNFVNNSKSKNASDKASAKEPTDVEKRKKGIEEMLK